ncbi:hypothetical protein QN277_019090 [Acacia crassicarpa]|uniref:Uncharacterized protein n=1 Tax=Acacia crassicarpa TaxID=499986 RepID=A0AAE1MV20_9FABA|nr:hypothetical protein QN277_019090 [Acacia crassicarpa]
MWKTATRFCTCKAKRRLELTSKASFTELQTGIHLLSQIKEIFHSNFIHQPNGFSPSSIHFVIMLSLDEQYRR